MFHTSKRDLNKNQGKHVSETTMGGSNPAPSVNVNEKVDHLLAN